MTRRILNIDEAINLHVYSALSVPNRASMLMAFGLNSVGNGTDASYHLPGFVQLVDAPDNLTDEQMKAFREDYRHWVVGNGFRTLIEGLEVFLNEVYQIIAKAECHFADKSINQADKSIKKFKGKGISGKLVFLEEYYSFVTGMKKYFYPLTKARNCLTHRLGFVGEEDFTEGTQFILSWLGCDIEITECDGTKHIINLDTAGPIEGSKFNQGAEAQLKTTMTSRRCPFALGERVTIKPRHLQEICLMSSYTIMKLHQLMINWLLDSGEFVNNGERVKEPKVSISLMCHWPYSS